MKILFPGSFESGYSDAREKEVGDDKKKTQYRRNIWTSGKAYFKAEGNGQQQCGDVTLSLLFPVLLERRDNGGKNGATVDQGSVPRWVSEAVDQYVAWELFRFLSLIHHSFHRGPPNMWNIHHLAGLTSHPEVVAATKSALEQFGAGSASSPLLGGNTYYHKDLEVALAKFLNKEACLLFPSGFAASMCLFDAVLGPRDAVFSDELNHASLITGMRWQ